MSQGADIFAWNKFCKCLKKQEYKKGKRTLSVPDFFGWNCELDCAVFGCKDERNYERIYKAGSEVSGNYAVRG